jgi:major membrane immunogen (membrane-anchored lipoprotein)
MNIKDKEGKIKSNQHGNEPDEVQDNNGNIRPKLLKKINDTLRLTDMAP